MPHNLLRTSTLTGLLIALNAVWCPAADQKPTDEQIQFFETKVRPVLAKRCYECHGPDEQTLDLRLDTVAGLFGGGVSGPAVVAGRPEGSLLITAIGYQDGELRMPPDKRLPDREIADLTEWVKMGAPHPEQDGSAPLPQATVEKLDIEEGREFWAFQPPAEPAVPDVKDTSWPASPLDHFILADLEANGLRPAPRADKRTLIRRATFDLTGLPPTPEEIGDFLADDSPQAFARVVDRLLASPHYGERWGRHWLDVARYADSNGLDENVAHGNAWRYRDYVVTAFNNDKPYDQFLLEQLAGDLLPEPVTASPESAMQRRHERLIATGFLSLGPKVLAEVDQTKMEMDIIDEQIDTLGQAVMGLTLGCARCHDHKYDPVPTEDYYALAGIFKSTRTMENFKVIAKWHENPLATEDDLARQEAHEKQMAQQQEAIQQLIDQSNEQLKAEAESKGEEEFTLPEDPEPLYPEQTRTELERLREELGRLEEAAPVMPTAMGVTDDEEIEDVPVHIRGSHLTLGEEVPRRVPLVLTGENQPSFEEMQSGRLQLAQWLIDPHHPLTSRVMVNRAWRWHFGEGLVRTTDNFGRLGEPPVNQSLLDWLAVRFVTPSSGGDTESEGRNSADAQSAGLGWSIKALHRLIMLSSTYQMSSDYDAEAAAADPENRLHWRMNVRRLEAEAIRDALLAVGGMLDRTMGGSMLHVDNREFIFNHTSEDGTSYDSHRRSLYLPVIRNHLYDVFELFDSTDASVSSGNRATTTVAPQALFMMNSDLVAETAEQMALELLECEEIDDAERIGLLYTKAYGRLPTEAEIERAQRLLQDFNRGLGEDDLQSKDVEQRRLRLWASLCQVIVASNEFVYIR